MPLVRNFETFFLHSSPSQIGLCGFDLMGQIQGLEVPRLFCEYLWDQKVHDSALV